MPITKWEVSETGTKAGIRNLYIEILEKVIKNLREDEPFENKKLFEGITYPIYALPTIIFIETKTLKDLAEMKATCYLNRESFIDDLVKEGYLEE